ncbi:hypothetical protein OAE26_01320 [Synechococcus sp. AH-551-E05]|nr:hypothetical protein [Synechococcus sp. AH-551-E05]MDB4651204.1 hypothetical protein [Synechococcus sp. AH-551-E05]
MIWLDQENGWQPAPSAALEHHIKQRLSLSQKQHEEVIFEEGDNLFLFLADATQSKECPLRKLNVPPFGAGQHFCPGKSISLIIHNICVKAVAMSGTLVHALPSEYKQNSLNAFVDYDQ